MSIDLDELRKALQTMGPRTQIYEVVRTELMKRGRWKNAPRGAFIKK